MQHHCKHVFSHAFFIWDLIWQYPHCRMETKGCSPCATVTLLCKSKDTYFSIMNTKKCSENNLFGVGIRSHVKLILVEWFTESIQAPESCIVPSRSGLVPAFCVCVGFALFCFWESGNKALWTKRQVSVRMLEMFHWPLAVPSVSWSQQWIVVAAVCLKLNSSVHDVKMRPTHTHLQNYPQLFNLCVTLVA